MVFIGTVDGRGIALDQKTGKEKWQVQLTDFANCHGCNFTLPPVVAGDVLTYGSTSSASSVHATVPNIRTIVPAFEYAVADGSSEFLISVSQIPEPC